MAGWVTQRDDRFTPATNVPERTRFEIEFCAPPGLGDVSGLVFGAINILPDSLRFQVTRMRLEQDSSGPGCINLFGLADRYRLTAWFAGTPEREESGIGSLDGATPQRQKAVGAVGLAPLVIPVGTLLLVVGVVAALAFVLGGITYAIIKEGIGNVFGYALIGLGILFAFRGGLGGQRGRGASGKSRAKGGGE